MADLMRGFGEHGLAVVTPVPAISGALVETVMTAVGEVHAMVVTAAPGEQIEVDALSPARAVAWGAALARLHSGGSGTAVRLPAAIEQSQ